MGGIFVGFESVVGTKRTNDDVRAKSVIRDITEVAFRCRQGSF